MADERKRAYERERYHWYLDNGICPKCTKNNLQSGYKRCLECRMREREYAEKHFAKETAEEKAARLAKHREKTAQIRQERREQGICIMCGKRKTNGHYNCEVCRAYKRKKQLEQNRKNGKMPIELRGEGYCSRCFKPTENGKLCAECYEHLVKQAEYMRSKQDNSEHPWRKASSADVDIIKRRQTNGEIPRIDFNAQGGKITPEENKRHTEAI